MYGKVGVQSLSSGGVGPMRIDERGALIACVTGGNLMEAALSGRLFVAAMQTPTTTSTTLNTTFVGLGLANPTGSGKVIVVHRFFYAATAALTGELLLALATTTDSGFEADITPRCCRYGYASSVAIVDKGATIIAPVIERIIATLGQSSDTAMGAANPPNLVDLAGSIILDPGRAVVTDTTVAAGAVMQFGYLWEEI
jgi:hypothetical protein